MIYIDLYTSFMFLDLVSETTYKRNVYNSQNRTKPWNSPKHTHTTPELFKLWMVLSVCFAYIYIYILYSSSLLQSPFPQLWLRPSLHPCIVKSATSNCELFEQWFYKLFSVRPWNQGIPTKQWYNLHHSPNGWSKKLCFWELVRFDEHFRFHVATGRLV